MDANRKSWNLGQQALQRALSRSEDHQKSIKLFLDQHAMVHSAALTRSGLWSFEDEIWRGLTEEGIRCIPPEGDHSIAWIFWHISRIEDVTMNLLVAGDSQVLNGENWLDQMKVSAHNTGNAMNEGEIADLSTRINLSALRAYRWAVGHRTRDIVKHLQPEDLKKKVDPSRLQRIKEEGAVVEAASALLDYWGKRTIAGLLLMPATRHIFIHLNEAERIKQKCQ
jgi:hypothetical protein